MRVRRKRVSELSRGCTFNEEGMCHDVIGHVVSDAKIIGSVNCHSPLKTVVEAVGSGITQTLVAEQMEVHAVSTYDQ